MPEPFYIAQSTECDTADKAVAWIRKHVAEAEAQGALTTRAYHEARNNLLLVEGWKEANLSDEDQGEPRVQPT